MFNKILSSFFGTRKRTIMTIVGVVLFFAAIILVREVVLQEEHVELPPLARTQVVALAGNTSEYSYPGEVRSQYESQLAFQIGGKIAKKSVNVGDVVKKGDVLLQIDAQDVAQMVNINSAAVSAARAKYNLAKENYDRFSKLYEQGATSQLEYENSATNYHAAAAALAQANASNAQSSNQLDYAVLRADKDGVVASVLVEEGQVVGPGQKVVMLVQDTALDVEISVPENKIDVIRTAQVGDISFWALPDTKAKGVITEISPMADLATRTYTVKIALVDPSPSILVGMSATVSFDPANAAKGMYIPLEAVYQTTTSPGVWLVKDNTVSLQKVEIAEFSGNQVEVVKGLSPGDRIVVAGVQKLSEGQEIRTERDVQ